MKLNISKGNMYDFVTHTWNPIKGRCYHDCAYCYMKKNGKILPPIYFDDTELKGIFQRDQLVFIGSSNDVFANEIPSDWITRILDFCLEATSYQKEGRKTHFWLQTKNPARILEFVNHPLLQSKRCVVCTTLETNRHYPEIMNNAPTPKERAEAVARIAELGITTYVTIEPIMDFDIDEFVELIKMCKPEQVNIGANTYKEVQVPQPIDGQILISLILQLLSFTKVKIKKNLKGRTLQNAIYNRIDKNYSFENRDDD